MKQVQLPEQFYLGYHTDSDDDDDHNDDDDQDDEDDGDDHNDDDDSNQNPRLQQTQAVAGCGRTLMPAM